MVHDPPHRASPSLSSRERVLRAIRHKPTDCIPATPYMYDVAAAVANVGLLDFYTRPEAMVHAQLGLHSLLAQDVICIGSDNYYIAEGFGCKTTRPADETPSLAQPAIESLNDVFGLTVPDAHTDGRMPVMIDAIRQVRRAVGDKVAIRCPGTGPFALASYLIGTQQWLMEVAMLETGMDDSKEPAIHHALELASDALIRFGLACFEAGADILHCGDSLASCDVISPATYRRFALPYQRKVIRAWREHGAPAALLHICGDSTSVLDLYRETGAHVIEIDHKVDLAHAKQSIGRDVALMGNLHTVKDLLRGDRQTVQAAAERCISQAATGSGFLLGSGCIVPRRTPLENLQQLVETAHAHPGGL